MPKTKVEVYDKDQLIYPYIESDHVTFSNGMKVSEMLDQSISMPTVVHENLSFKVGVGDQDVSSAIVDSSVAEMTIKGKTYQNILPEPSTHVLTNNKEMFKVNEGLDPNVEIVDGVSKSAILTGQTLVNLIKDNTEDGVLLTEGHKDLKLLYTLKNSTQYTLLMNVVSVNDNNTSNWWCGIMKTGDWGSESKQYVKGINKLLFTTKEESNCYAVRIRGLGTTIKDVMLLEGDYTNVDIPYFEGMQSVKMPVLTTTGKNLLDFEKTQNGYLGANPHGLNAPDLNNKTSDYIRVKPNTTYTYSFDGFTASQVGNEYWTGWYYYTSPTEVSKKNMNRQVARGSADTFKTVTFTTPSDCYYVRIGSRGLALSGAIAQLEEGSTATSYEPYKTNILSTPEEVVLREVNGVKDTLNLNTGEYVQHIKEVVFDGSSDESIDMTNVNDTTLVRFNINNVAGVQTGNTNKVLCSSLPYLYIHGLSGGSTTVSQECISNHSKNANAINIVIKRSRLSSVDVAGFRAYLQSNPITIQYSIATPVIKTVDLSSSGNWEKVVLNGSENWTQSTANNNYFMETFVIKSNYNTGTENLVFSGDHRLSVAKVYTSNTNIGLCIEKGGGLRIRTQQVLGGQSIEDFKAYLSQNPVMVYYQTKNHQDSTQVKQPIFFKDGHIQLSSGTDNSLIPTLDYQAKTSNSYVMDLMKANTRYTMKAKSASGTFTIDGTSYGAVTNGTFTTPSSMTNKFLVMNNKTNEEVMILEGDIVSKTIPYFKGIKSAFEGEDKIEVLSTGKNLFDVNLIYGAHTYGNVGQKPSHGTGYARVTNETGDYILVKPDTKYTFSIENNFSFAIAQLDKDGISLGDTGWVNNKSSWTITTKSTARYVGFNIRKLDDSDITPDEVYKAYPMFEESLSATTYEPHKSNNTKIPLLSALRSLPNGVCDELIVDRMKNKATLIQRIKSTVFNGSENWSLNGYSHDKLVEFVCHGGVQMAHTIFSDRFTTGGENVERVAFSGGSIYIRILKTKASNVDSFKKWLSQNPLTIQCGLQTPVITEVDIEGFPYIYKDGHILLNSEITPTTEIIYSINQCQQISASNEDIIRHEKELTYLQKLIAQYVQVDYESALLSLKV